MWLATILGWLLAAFTICHGVPPSVCHEKFNWHDCGTEPTPVIYYWKPGSRCEVGLWRGCRPAANMFRSEEECVATCIFGHGPRADDYHKLKDFNENDIEIQSTPATLSNDRVDATTVNSTTQIDDSTNDATMETTHESQEPTLPPTIPNAE